MNALDSAVQEALASEGNNKEANKAYLEFIKANFMIPIERAQPDEEPRVLFLQDQEQCFLPVFTELEHLNAWAQEISADIQLLRLSGVDLLKGLGENVTVCLNIGTALYKEFNPSETARMRSMVLKLFK